MSDFKIDQEQLEQSHDNNARYVYHYHEFRPIVSRRHYRFIVGLEWFAAAFGISCYILMIVKETPELYLLLTLVFIFITGILDVLRKLLKPKNDA